MKPAFYVTGLWKWAHEEFGDAICNLIQEECDDRAPPGECICGEVLCMLAALTIATKS